MFLGFGRNVVPDLRAWETIYSEQQNQISFVHASPFPDVAQGLQPCARGLICTDDAPVNSTGSGMSAHAVTKNSQTWLESCNGPHHWNVQKRQPLIAELPWQWRPAGTAPTRLATNEKISGSFFAGNNVTLPFPLYTSETRCPTLNLETSRTRSACIYLADCFRPALDLCRLWKNHTQDDRPTWRSDKEHLLC